MSKEEMVLVIDRTDIDVDLIAPLQIIMPALVLACPFSLYTTLGREIKTENLYDGLVEECRIDGYSSLTETLREILKAREGRAFRVCVLGGRKVSWDVVLEYKRRQVMIDTVGRTLHLNQVSYTTGGIAKEVDEHNIITQFLTVFSMSSNLRGWFNLQENQKISFHLECQACPEQPQELPGRRG